MNTKFMDTKHEFAKEIMKILYPGLARACLDVMENIPYYFWEIPAFPIGKNHPVYDLNKGGLVRHSIKVATIADELIVSGAWVEDTLLNHAIARVAGLFHDVLKYGIPDADGNYSEHPELNPEFLSANWVMKNMREKVDTKLLFEICDAIRCHGCKWNLSEYEDEELPVIPSSPMEKLVHTAHFVASSKWVNGL